MRKDFAIRQVFGFKRLIPPKQRRVPIADVAGNEDRAFDCDLEIEHRTIEMLGASKMIDIHRGYDDAFRLQIHVNFLIYR
jgi:hypothetical protein